MYCKHCGKKIDVDSAFCRYCGGKISQSQSQPYDKSNSESNKKPLIRSDTKTKIQYDSGGNDVPKYDETAKPNYAPAWVGGVFGLMILVLSAVGDFESEDTLYFSIGFFILIRIIALIWVIDIVKSLNRKYPDNWGLFAVLLPIPCLITIGFQKRLIYPKKYPNWSNQEKSSYNNDLAWKYVEIDRLREAKQLVNLAITLNNNNYYAYNIRAYIKYRQEDYEEALSDSNKSIELDSTSGKRFFRRGNIHLALNDTTSACNDWIEAANLGYDPALDQIEKYC